VELWSKASAGQRAAITEQAELLAQYRNTQLTGVDTTDRRAPCSAT